MNDRRSELLQRLNDIATQGKLASKRKDLKRALELVSDAKAVMRQLNEINPGKWDEDITSGDRLIEKYGSGPCEAS